MGFEGPSPGILILLSLILLPVILLPTIIAVKTKHPCKTPIILINVCAGLSGISWVVALVLCFMPSDKCRYLTVKSTINKHNQY